MRKYHGEQLPEVNGEKQPVSKVHFLIHPGYISNSKALSLRTTAEKLRSHHQKFIDKAKTLHETEIMFAFAPANKEKFKTDVGKGDGEYIQLLKTLKEILGKRLIVLTDDLNVWSKTVTAKEGAITILPTMEKLAEARGYKLSKEMLSEVYGELVTFCVNHSGYNLNEALDLTHPTAIKTQLTDMPLEVTAPGKALNNSFKEDKTDNLAHQKRVFFDFE